MRSAIALAALVGLSAAADCPAYEQYARERHEPFSGGKYKFPSQRPSKECRSFVVPEVERVITDMKDKVHDPDLYQLFLNTWPNTVDTTVLWQGKSADNAEEELAFVITGDINAMWLRDSANQLQSYKPILNDTGAVTNDMGAVANDTNTVAALFRGAINLQARYLRKNPYCNAFQPPAESKIPPVNHGKRAAPAAGNNRALPGQDTVSPPYDPAEVWECKYELDSLGAFLQLSHDYYEATGDVAFFGRFSWRETVRVLLDTAHGLTVGTYDAEGRVRQSPYTWLREANTATEVVANRGAGSPVADGIGMIRSFFRPSDDSTIYQYFVPANMMFAQGLRNCAVIMESVDAALAREMGAMAASIRKAIDEYGVVKHPKYGEIYAYEVDGFGSVNFMDDANIPSLLSIPHLGYDNAGSAVYKRTRDFVLSRSNPYFNTGPVINSTGGPHLGPGKAWPMGVIMRIMTSDEDDEIIHGLETLLGSTSGLGLIHESVNTFDDSNWSRSWFAWANGLFGQMLIDLSSRKPKILERSFQG
ncbi:Six-hairpin glycosidase [Cordyceps fumosorosea ARSEF 2679]|uniref:Six-hairpin glycosidase n=1 Tax=Cordyceps fumosorosea (strain ARSEF 2679) TaxID=1081104 RepID=A0A167SC86_CORFA|nr:Six-hairpin glycosidase [Cordyceps fumosorosea ARSEF 2679]OAA59478.1 Six-hairpin glycosidase [Cordyceps fumosorosea ARSEF 2679]